MNNSRPYWKVIVSVAFSITITVLFVLIGWQMLRFLMPFVIGWFISVLANPIVLWLEKKFKLVKKWGSAITIVVVLGIVIGILYLAASVLVRELGGLLSSLPEIYESISMQMDEIAHNLSGVLRFMPSEVKSVGAAVSRNMGDVIGDWVSKLGEPTVSLAGDVAKRIPGAIIGSFVAVLSAYFFVADRESVMIWAKKVTPKSIYDRMSFVISNFKFTVGGYFKAQFKIMGVVAAILVIGLSLLNVKHAIILSILIALLDFLPFLGTGTAFWPWCIYTILCGDYKRFLFLFIIYVTTQVVRQTIQPKLVGDEVGLNPLPTLLFIYIGYRLGGVIWMIIAVPVGMIIINMYKAGAFDYILDDVKILVKGILDLRK